VVQIWAGTKDVSFPKQPGQFSGTASIISDGYHALYLVVKLTTHLDLEPWLRMKRAISLLHHMASRYARDLTVIRKNNFWILYNVVSIAVLYSRSFISAITDLYLQSINIRGNDIREITNNAFKKCELQNGKLCFSSQLR
jgi:hypothetical protein